MKLDALRYIPASFLTVFAVLIVSLPPMRALAVFDHQLVLRYSLRSNDQKIAFR